MISLTGCDRCNRKDAVEDVMTSITSRRGMSLRDIRVFLLLRHGYDSERSSKLVKELLDGRLIEGGPSRYRRVTQKGIIYVK